MSSKRQQTMAKITRERTVKEKRARKLEKKQAAAAGGLAPRRGALVGLDRRPLRRVLRRRLDRHRAEAGCGDADRSRRRRADPLVAPSRPVRMGGFSPAPCEPGPPRRPRPGLRGRGAGADLL